MHDEGIDLTEAALVQEKVQALASGELPFGMLLLDARHATAQFGLGFQVAQMLKLGIAAQAERSSAR
jgi:hypothetical protein